ncbi:hypothetical protein [Stackebrandtia nassauensis]|uniref:Uncharacterized protein n=1 Tax=Stackebrandtia nassauensis (strain DSM 44728 / CIP 108903 / NRRL B-16338 / NBRC 102104 / LLR-40K-21) TaxID=446470 RepID=D3Q379_STANL|nr:hypothetical protein [Stackebrandtia nassauensis]ADD40049.1 hypothetical protein Snas_0331 [Stackebrandtia nassauensis DSM 44728]
MPFSQSHNEFDRLAAAAHALHDAVHEFMAEFHGAGAEITDDDRSRKVFDNLAAVDTDAVLVLDRLTRTGHHQQASELAVPSAGR